MVGSDVRVRLGLPLVHVRCSIGWLCVVVVRLRVTRLVTGVRFTQVLELVAGEIVRFGGGSMCSAN